MQSQSMTMPSFRQQPMVRPMQSMSWGFEQPANQFSSISQGKAKMVQEQESKWDAEALL